MSVSKELECLSITINNESTNFIRRLGNFNHS